MNHSNKCAPLTQPQFHVVGGGLAGIEAAWQILRAGHAVVLHEMRPTRTTPAHQTAGLGELVCSNSLKSTAPHSAPQLLKEEMSRLGSLLLSSAEKVKVPAGQALGVDREALSREIEVELLNSPRFTCQREEVTSIPEETTLASRGEYWIIASGPLSSEALTAELQRLCGTSRHLAFYDAIAPTIAADSINMDIAFAASRYDKGEADYLNLPLTREEYEAFVTALLEAEQYPLHDFEKPMFFEGCLPVEVIASRGRDTLRFGPMKPVGLTDPRTGRWPYAAVQLRVENSDRTMYSLVGFQTKTRRGAQERVFRMLPGLEKAEFLRFGSIHRNTYVQSPQVLNPDLSFKTNSRVFLAGQLTGVEGYIESAAMGILAARFALGRFAKHPVTPPPFDTILGGLLRYVTHGGTSHFQPMNANLGLLPPIAKQRGQNKEQRKAAQATASQRSFSAWLEALQAEKNQ